VYTMIHAKLPANHSQTALTIALWPIHPPDFLTTKQQGQVD
jgi:hypothetical protein